MHLSSYFLTHHMLPEDNLHILNKPIEYEHDQYLHINPYLSSNRDSDLYYYIYYPYICYYFLSLSILSFIISKWIESISIPNTRSKIFIYNRHTENLILSYHITSHLLLTITHILIMHHQT